jgi:hypothetical protein
MTERLDWNIAVYAANEGERLGACLRSVVHAVSGMRALITVILNGSRDGSVAIAQGMARAGAPIEIFSIDAADKSNAINQFYYRLRSPAHAYAGVDGYAVVSACAFAAMAEKLANDPHALAVTGVSRNGRTMAAATARTLQVGGQLHGQLHALRPDFIDRIVARGIRLPIGLYRGDGLLGSMAAHDLDPTRTPWDNARIVGVPDATYEIATLSLRKPSDIRRQLRRMVRQARGRVENAAIKEIIYRSGYEALPAFADDMLRANLAAHGRPAVALSEAPFMAVALRSLEPPRTIAASALEPRRVA